MGVMSCAQPATMSGQPRRELAVVPLALGPLAPESKAGNGHEHCVPQQSRLPTQIAHITSNPLVSQLMRLFHAS